MAGGHDRRIVLGIFGGVVACIVAFSIFAPAHDDSDRSPTTYNSGSAGTKAAYLLLEELGYGASALGGGSGRVEERGCCEDDAGARGAELSWENAKEVQADVADFLSRGGGCWLRGREGAYFLPGGKTGEPTRLYKSLCFSTAGGRMRWRGRGRFRLRMRFDGRLRGRSFACRNFVGRMRLL